jgi:hypothetical protein
MNIEKFKADFKENQMQSESLKTQFETFIADKSIPLEERWDFFQSMPGVLKEQDIFAVNFFVFKEYIPKFSWYDDFGMEQGHAQHMDDIMKRIEEEIKDYKSYPQSINRVGKAFVKNPTAMAEFKEEILHRNLKGFIFDE